MKILIIANNDSGLFFFRKELIIELLKNNDVILAAPYGDLIKPLEDLGCKFINTNVDRRGMNPIKDIALYVKYKAILNKEKPDYVITYTIKPNVYGGFAARRKKIKYAVNITGLGSAFQVENIIKRIVTFLYKLSCKDADVVFFENEENRQIFVNEGIVDEKNTHCLNGAGVNLDKFSVLEYPINSVAQFLFIGRVMKEKGIEELISSIRRLVKEGEKVQLSILGSYENDYKNMIEKCENEGWLKYYGFQNDVIPYIKRCDCFVLPSWHEGMANTNLECAASGRPIITTRIHGCMEAVVEDVSGFLVEKKNENSLYEAMKKFLALTREEKMKMGLCGRKHMEEKFDKKKVVQDTINSLNKSQSV